MNEYEIAFTIGGCITVLWVVAYLSCWAGQWVWAWIDDSKTGGNNAILQWVMAKQGWKKTDSSGGCWAYYKGKDYWDNNAVKSDGAVIFFPVAVLLGFSPVIALSAFKVYPIALTIGVLIGIAFLARFARRNKKMFDAHVEDKDAHKPV